MTAFHNNLCKDDPVLHVETKRPGRVAAQPRETSRSVAVIFQGRDSIQRVDILSLRLIVDGKPEDTPPCDGEPEEAATEAPAHQPARNGHGSPIDALKAARQAIAEQMKALNAKFAALREEAERLDRAILCLEPPRAPSMPTVPRT